MRRSHAGAGCLASRSGCLSASFPGTPSVRPPACLTLVMPKKCSSSPGLRTTKLAALPAAMRETGVVFRAGTCVKTSESLAWPRPSLQAQEHEENSSTATVVAMI